MRISDWSSDVCSSDLMAFGARTKTTKNTGFSPGAGAVVLSADRSRILEAGDDEVGWTARRGRVPVGYLNDRNATEATFPILATERFSVPGDRAKIGSAPCRGRGCQYVSISVVAVSLKKKNQ